MEKWTQTGRCRGLTGKTQSHCVSGTSHNTVETQCSETGSGELANAASWLASTVVPTHCVRGAAPHKSEGQREETVSINTIRSTWWSMPNHNVFVLSVIHSYNNVNTRYFSLAALVLITVPSI